MWKKVRFSKSRNKFVSECSRCTHQWETGNVAYKKSFGKGAVYVTEFVCKKCANLHGLKVDKG